MADTPGGPPVVKARLAQVLPRVWDNIPQKHFEALWKSMPARVEAVIEEGMVHAVLSKIFRCRRKVGMSCWYPGLGQGWGLLACILTPPQHIVKFFCYLHRLSYYVVMLRYFFRILFSSLCCAVIDFIAVIVHGALFDIFSFWACNSPYFNLIFLLP